MAGTHRGINQEASRKIDKHNNGKSEHETTGTSINQKEKSRYRPIGQEKYQCSFMYYCGPNYNTRGGVGGLFRFIMTLPDHILQIQ